MDTQTIEQLAAAAQERLASGVSKEDIEQELFAAGYNAGEVAEVFSKLQSAPQTAVTAAAPAEQETLSQTEHTAGQAGSAPIVAQPESIEQTATPTSKHRWLWWVLGVLGLLVAGFAVLLFINPALPAGSNALKNRALSELQEKGEFFRESNNGNFGGLCAFMSLNESYREVMADPSWEFACFDSAEAFAGELRLNNGDYRCVDSFGNDIVATESIILEVGCDPAVVTVTESASVPNNEVRDSADVEHEGVAQDTDSREPTDSTSGDEPVASEPTRTLTVEEAKQKARERSLEIEAALAESGYSTEPKGICSALSTEYDLASCSYEGVSPWCESSEQVQRELYKSDSFEGVYRYIYSQQHISFNNNDVCECSENSNKRKGIVIGNRITWTEKSGQFADTRIYHDTSSLLDLYINDEKSTTLIIEGTTCPNGTQLQTANGKIHAEVCACSGV